MGRLSVERSQELVKELDGHPGLRRLFEDYIQIADCNPDVLQAESSVRGKMDDIAVPGFNRGGVQVAVDHLRDWVLNSGQPVGVLLNGNPDAKTSFLKAITDIQQAAMRTGVEQPEFFEHLIDDQRKRGLEIDASYIV